MGPSLPLIRPHNRKPGLERLRRRCTLRCLAEHRDRVGQAAELSWATASPAPPHQQHGASGSPHWRPLSCYTTQPSWGCRRPPAAVCRPEAALAGQSQSLDLSAAART